MGGGTAATPSPPADISPHASPPAPPAGLPHGGCAGDSSAAARAAAAGGAGADGNPPSVYDCLEVTTAFHQSGRTCAYEPRAQLRRCHYHHPCFLVWYIRNMLHICIVQIICYGIVLSLPLLSVSFLCWPWMIGKKCTVIEVVCF